MFTTCGSSSRWVRRSTPPNVVMRASCSAVQSSASSGAHARIVRNFSISKGDTRPPGARLAVEQRTTVADQVADHHERGDQREDRPRPQSASATSNSRFTRPYHAACSSPMSNSSDTRSSSDDRQLAQPLLVEQRQRADPYARLVQHRCLQHDVVVVLRRAAQHQDRRAAPPAAASTSGRAGGTLVDGRLDRRQPADDQRRAFGARRRSASSDSISSAAATTSTRSRSPARSSMSARSPRRARSRARARATLPNTTKRGSSASPDEQLDGRHRQRRPTRWRTRRRRSRRGGCASARAGRTRTRSRQSDTIQASRPGEPGRPRPHVAGRHRVRLAQTHDRR